MCLVQPIVDCRSFSSVGIQEETQEGSGLTVVVEVEGGSDPPPHSAFFFRDHSRSRTRQLRVSIVLDFRTHDSCSPSDKLVLYKVVIFQKMRHIGRSSYLVLYMTCGMKLQPA